MSVANCFTDYHIGIPFVLYQILVLKTDFGGTSVWYHILKGEKVCFKTLIQITLLGAFFSGVLADRAHRGKFEIV